MLASILHMHTILHITTHTHDAGGFELRKYNAALSLTVLYSCRWDEYKTVGDLVLLILLLVTDFSPTANTMSWTRIQKNCLLC